ncbi:SpaA isopeptide-forming pilin-related protein [Erysipelothrix rhusiopathiae]|nr:SpaA isopeptide-forming pilin-related protein [Erysipelothrix rhusiopathiae]
MQKLFKKLGISVMTFLLVITGFITNISADSSEVYHNEDMSIVVMVNRNVIDNELNLDFETNTADGITIDNFKVDDISIKNDDYRCTYAVGMNGDYKFVIEYTRDVVLEKENEEAQIIQRHETFEFTVKVDELKADTTKETTATQSVATEIDEPQEDQDENEPIPAPSVDLQTEVINGITITTHEDGTRTLSALPHRDDLDLFITGDEYVLLDNETGVISIERLVKPQPAIRRFRRSVGNVVTTGQKVIPAGETITVTWRADRSFYWQLWGGISELFVNGNRAYCLEPSIFDLVATNNAFSTTLDSVNGVRVHPDGRLAFTPTHSQKKNIELIANYGYKYPGHQTIRYEWATKKLIWNEMGWDVSGGMNVDSEMAEIQSLIAQHSDVPSWDGQTRQVRKGDVIDLSESGLNKFIVYSYEGLEIVKDSGDTLKVKVIDKNARLILDKKGGSEKGTSYVYSDGVSQKVAHIKIGDPVDTFIKFEAKTEDITFKKTDTNGTPVAGVVVETSYQSDMSGQTWKRTTDKNGQFVSRDWETDRTMYYREVSAPAPYVVDSTIKSHRVVEGENKNIISMVNKFQRSNITLTKIENDWDQKFPENKGKKLSGASIELYAKEDIYEGSHRVYQAGDLLGTKVTDSTGKVVFKNVPIGQYYAKETKAPEGYVLFQGQGDISIKYDGGKPTVQVTETGTTVSNQVIYGQAKLIKTDGNRKLLEGVVFGVYRIDGTLIEEKTTDENGEILTSNLRYGDYYFKEHQSLSNYWPDETPVYFSIQQHKEVKHVTMANKQVLVHLEWSKTNEDGMPLEGVGFKVKNTKTNEFVTLSYADGKKVVEEDIWFTDAQGDVFIKGLIEAGEYELVEVEPLDGYQVIQPLKFTVDNKQNYIDLGALIGLSLNVGDVVNAWNRGNLKITKCDIDTKEALSNFGFKLYDMKNNLIGYYETGADGTVSIDNLKYGTYVVEEVKVGGDYGIDPQKARQEVFIEEHGKTYEVTFENKHADIKTNASFVACDKENPDIVTLVDVVKYTDLQVGKEYVLDGTLMYKDIQKPVKIDYEIVKGQTVFTPTSKDGSIEVKFTLDASKLEAKTLVVFEDLSREKQSVVVHHDINDIDQTVTIPEIGTSLTYTNRDKETPNIVTLTDKVRYNDLVLGKEYTVKGQLQDGLTGLPLLIDGKTVDGETTFIANQKDGFVDVTFTFDQNKLEKEKIVAFENLYEKERLIAVHADLEDKDQTIEIITYRILKKDIDTKEVLKEAEFTRYDLDGNIIEVLNTDEKGVVEFKLFKGEVNTAKETGAPLGYKLSDEVVTMDTNVSEDGSLFVIEYYNELLPDDALPATGVSNSFTIVATILVVLGGIFIALNKLFNKRKVNVVGSTTIKNSPTNWFKNILNGFAVLATSAIVLGISTVSVRADVIDDLNSLWNNSKRNIGRLLTLIGTVITSIATVVLFIAFVILLFNFVMSRRRGEDTSEKMMPLFGVLIGFAIVIALSAFGWASLI